MLKTLSFCLTTYDKDYHLLPRVWESLRLQTVAPDEIIIVSSGLPMSSVQDGGSIEISGKTVPIYGVNSFKRVTAASARNIAASLASKDIIQFFDADDYLHQDHIKVTKTIFENYSDCAALLHSYIKSIENIPPIMAVSHSYDKNNVKDMRNWDSDRNRPVFPAVKVGDGIALGPIAILSHIFEQVKYKKVTIEDVNMAHQLFVEKNVTVKSYVFPLMTYFPAAESGRGNTGNLTGELALMGNIGNDLSKPFPHY